MEKHVAQWDSTREDANISGLHRYSTELYNRSSLQMPVKRYFYNGFNTNSIKSYIPGDVTHITTQSFAFLKTLKHVKNCVVTVNDIIPEIWYNRVEKIKSKWILSEFVLDRADKYITISNYTKQTLLKYYPKIDEDKIKVIYDGVDHNIFYPKNKEECRTRFNFESDKYYLLAVSSGLKWKNMELLERLSGILSNEYRIINIGYGNGKLGYITDKDLSDLYNACDIFLTPSKAEGFCLPVMEAMACGTPVIAANATALPEVVKDGGYLANPDDEYDWLNAIELMLTPAGRVWSDRALKRSQEFSWDKCANETLVLYNEMLE